MVSEVNDIKQRLCNLVSYILWLYEKKYINERTKDELLKRINPEAYERSDSNVKTR